MDTCSATCLFDIRILHKCPSMQIEKAKVLTNTHTDKFNPTNGTNINKCTFIDTLNLLAQLFFEIFDVEADSLTVVHIILRAVVDKIQFWQIEEEKKQMLAGKVFLLLLFYSPLSQSVWHQLAVNLATFNIGPMNSQRCHRLKRNAIGPTEEGQVNLSSLFTFHFYFRSRTSHSEHSFHLKMHRQRTHCKCKTKYTRTVASGENLQTSKTNATNAIVVVEKEAK